MNYFINFNAQTGRITINRYRNNGMANADVIGLVEDMEKGISSTCSVKGALAALEDGSIWNDDQQEIIENLHATLWEFNTDPFFWEREGAYDELDELAADY